MYRDPMQKSILAFGETLWDLLPSGPALGGAPFNLAYRVHSLGDRSLMVTRLGRDDLGQGAFESISALGMDTSFVQWDDKHPTGTVEVTFDEARNPHFRIIPDVAYDFIEWNDQLSRMAGEADCICFGTVAQRAQTSRRTLRRLLEESADTLKLLDLNLRPDCYYKETIVESLQRAQILKLNLQEAHYLAELFEISDPSLAGFCGEMLPMWNLTHCLVTLGEYGVFAASESEQVYLPGYAIQPVDTVGAGDAFSAGFLHAFLQEKPLAECCRFGNALGAMVALQHGATTPVSVPALEAFLRTEAPKKIETTLKDYCTT
jgi:fructokinase